MILLFYMLLFILDCLLGDLYSWLYFIKVIGNLIKWLIIIL